MTRLSVVAIDAYKRWLSHRIGASCRFTPTCSQYAREALLRHGFVRGWGMALARIGRCRPRGARGLDPVP